MHSGVEILAPPRHKRPVVKPQAKVHQTVSEYNRRNSGVKTELAYISQYKAKSVGVPLESAAGSTTPLMFKSDMSVCEQGVAPYDPFQHRKVPHPTSNMETLIHLLKGSLGSGILAMPYAFANAGSVVGIVGTIFIGFVCTYCVHILVKCAHILLTRVKKPSLGFADVAETAFMMGPKPVRKFSRLARFLINTFLVIDLLGCCCVYMVFVSENIKQVVDYHTNSGYDVRFYMLALLPLLIISNFIRSLKYMAPLSMAANLMIGASLAITMYYVFVALPGFSSVPMTASILRLPLFFGNAIFALEGIGVVMPLENNMKDPRSFIGCPSVLNTGMIVVVSLYTSVGFLGFLRYGDEIKSSISLNLPQDEILAQSVKIMIALAMFLTYNLQFYVPFEIIWNSIESKLDRKNLWNYMLRIVLITLTVGIAIAVPNLGPFMSLVGAVCLSTLGLIFPAIIELVTYWERPGLGTYNWRLWKNIFVISFGVLGFCTGLYTSLEEIIATY